MQKREIWPPHYALRKPSTRRISERRRCQPSRSRWRVAERIEDALAIVQDLDAKTALVQVAGWADNPGRAARDLRTPVWVTAARNRGSAGRRPKRSRALRWYRRTPAILRRQIRRWLRLRTWSSGPIPRRDWPSWKQAWDASTGHSSTPARLPTSNGNCRRLLKSIAVRLARANRAAEAFAVIERIPHKPAQNAAYAEMAAALAGLGDLNAALDCLARHRTGSYYSEAYCEAAGAIAVLRAKLGQIDASLSGVPGTARLQVHGAYPGSDCEGVERNGERRPGCRGSGWVEQAGDTGGRAGGDRVGAERNRPEDRCARHFRACGRRGWRSRRARTARSVDRNRRCPVARRVSR